jgi:hypothetical protein
LKTSLGVHRNKAFGYAVKVPGTVSAGRINRTHRLAAKRPFRSLIFK